MNPRVYTYILFMITFLCTSIIGYSQSIQERLDLTISEFELMYKTGAMSKQDSLLTSFQHIEQQTQNAPLQNTKATVYIARILSNKRRFNEAEILIKKAKKSYEAASLNDLRIKHTIAYYEMYLDIQVSKKYDTEKIKTYVTTYKNKPGNDPFIEALSYEYMGRIKQDWREYEMSISNLTKAIELFSNLGYKYQVSIAYSIMGATYDLIEDFEMAAKYYEKSLQIGDQLQEPSLDVLASTSYNLALLFGDRLGNNQKGLFYAQEAVKYDSKANEKNPYLALDYNQVATSYMKIGDYTKAQIYGEKALEHAKLYLNQQPSRIAESLRTLGKVYAQIGRKEEAISLAEEAIDIVIKVVPENHHWVCAGYLHLANTYKYLGMLDKAEVYFLKTERVAQAINRDLFLIDVYNSLPELYLKTNQLEKVPPLLEKSQEVLQDRFKDADYFHRRDEMNTIIYYTAINDIQNATQALKSIREKIPQKYTYPDIELKIEAYELLLNTSPTSKEYEHFLRTIIDHKNRFPNQFNKIMYGNTIKELLAKIISKIYDRIQLEDSEDLKSIFFRYLEINKNSVLLEGIQGTRFKKVAGIPEELLYTEAQLLDSLQRNNKRIYNTKQSKYKDSDKIQKLYNRQLLFEHTYDSLQSVILNTYPKLKNLKYLSATKDFNDFTNVHLQEEEAIIMYFIDTHTWYRFTITKNKNQIEQFSTSKLLKEDINQLVTSISKQKFNSSLSQKMYDQLLPELPDEITKLTFITDDILSLLPFEVLQQKETFLIEKYAISYAGSLQLLEEQINLNNRGKGWLGFAPKYYKNPLPNNAKEVKEIEKITNGKSYLGEEATKENFIALSKEYNILHLATHTEVDQNNPLYNKMLFSQKQGDSLLTASEIYGLNLKANLAVLSSCNTGFGKLEKGEGVMSMSRAFTYAGVGSTLMTLWKVPDQETATITTYFYTNLESEMTKDKALQEAKRLYLSTTTDQDLKQPYYWAGFILSGDTSPIGNASYMWWYIAGGILLLGLLYTLSRKRTKANE
ncbi:CHAT domain-containing protein [uncultured Dokdonia sp.]|uniref:CHAT domain-containing protein n=1 Tax=uncultured Dokdonia sp. TaxID=575653 RepID=UPI00261A832E|nr:CHAT domain-containing protein [uncultured Dokdonia sp.]